MANKRRKTRSLFAAEASALGNRPSEMRDSGFRVPTWVVNFWIGLFLLPVAGILTQTFFNAFRRATTQHAFWATEEFWFFSVGALFWTVLFFGVPRRFFTYIYVFGHEHTHAVWVFLMGGRVSHMEYGSNGGHIITDKNNVWIALAPYFYPIYSMALLVVYAIAAVFVNVELYHRWFFALLGFTWAFHISFTLWMIPKGQTDLSYHGTFYSLVLIYIMNLVVLSIMLIVGSQHVTWLGFGHELFDNSLNFSAWAVELWQRWVAGPGPAA